MKTKNFNVDDEKNTTGVNGKTQSPNLSGDKQNTQQLIKNIVTCATSTVAS